MSHGLVSVIIPSFNRAHLVIGAIESVLSQTYKQVEVIVIDDGSSDNTKEIIRDNFSASEPRVRYFFQKNAGVSAARNHGFRQVQGEFIAFLDSDDRWSPEKLELQLLALESEPQAVMTWTDMAAINTAGKVIHERFLKKMYHAYRFFPKPQDLFKKTRSLREITESSSAAIPESAKFYVGDIFSGMSLGNLVHTSTVLLRTEAQKRAGGFNEAFRTGEDYPFHLKVSSLGPSIFIDLPLIQYRIGAEDALTSSKYLLEASQNFLSTIQNTFAQRRTLDSANFPVAKSLLRKGLADAHIWVADESLKNDMRFSALLHLCQSFLILPNFKSIPKMFLKVIFPQKILRLLKSKK